MAKCSLRTEAVALLLCLTLLCFVVAGAQAQKPDKQQRKQDSANQEHAAEIEAAQKSAGDWLVLLDQEKYAESWKESASFLQSQVPEAAWEKRLNTVRKPIDPLVDRTLHTTQWREQLPGLPPGRYVAFVYESYFGTKHAMLESVIMSFEKDAWKPVGYAVQ